DDLLRGRRDACPDGVGQRLGDVVVDVVEDDLLARDHPGGGDAADDGTGHGARSDEPDRHTSSRCRFASRHSIAAAGPPGPGTMGTWPRNPPPPSVARAPPAPRAGPARPPCAGRRPTGGRWSPPPAATADWP